MNGLNSCIFKDTTISMQENPWVVACEHVDTWLVVNSAPKTSWLVTTTFCRSTQLINDDNENDVEMRYERYNMHG